MRGNAIDTILSYVFINSLGTADPLAYAYGDSPILRRAKKAYLLPLMHCQDAFLASGTFSVKCASMADPVNGLNGLRDGGWFFPGNNCYNYSTGTGKMIPVATEDVLSIAFDNLSTIEGKFDSLLTTVYYEGINGQSANLLDAQEYNQRQTGRTYQASYLGAASPSGLPGYNLTIPLSSFTRNFQSGKELALRGIASVNFADSDGLPQYSNYYAACIRGEGTGGYRIPVPMDVENAFMGKSRDYFLDRARHFGKPFIPVIKADDWNSYFIDLCYNEAIQADGNLILFFSELT